MILTTPQEEEQKTDENLIVISASSVPLFLSDGLQADYFSLPRSFMFIISIKVFKTSACCVTMHGLRRVLHEHAVINRLKRSPLPAV